MSASQPGKGDGHGRADVRIWISSTLFCFCVNRPVERSESAVPLLALCTGQKRAAVLNAALQIRPTPLQVALQLAAFSSKIRLKCAVYCVPRRERLVGCADPQSPAAAAAAQRSTLSRRAKSFATRDRGRDFAPESLYYISGYNGYGYPSIQLLNFDRVTNFFARSERGPFCERWTCPHAPQGCCCCASASQPRPTLAQRARATRTAVSTASALAARALLSCHTAGMAQKPPRRPQAKLEG
jgi:hypothetical protein